VTHPLVSPHSSLADSLRASHSLEDNKSPNSRFHFQPLSPKGKMPVQQQKVTPNNLARPTALKLCTRSSNNQQQQQQQQNYLQVNEYPIQQAIRSPPRTNMISTNMDPFQNYSPDLRASAPSSAGVFDGLHGDTMGIPRRTSDTMGDGLARTAAEQQLRASNPSVASPMHGHHRVQTAQTLSSPSQPPMTRHRRAHTANSYAQQQNHPFDVHSTPASTSLHDLLSPASHTTQQPMQPPAINYQDWFAPASTTAVMARPATTGGNMAYWCIFVG